MSDAFSFKSPIGTLTIREENDRITELFLQRGSAGLILPQNAPCSDLLYEAYRQLTEYFAGRRMDFDLPLNPAGTLFQQMVWIKLQAVPYGETRSYEEIAVEIGDRKAVRAVGQANGRNPILIVIPCHRVIRKSGELGGYACGLDVKKYLLELEKGGSSCSL